MTANKDSLRRAVKETNLGGDPREICRRIVEHPWYRQAQTVMAYCAKAPEPDITAVLEDILSSGKTLLLPQCESERTMTARRIGALSELRRGVYGIYEPEAETETVEQGRIDLILVPGLAFDKSGVRLGRGKGYYDRFLAEYSGKTLGVCFHAALLDRIEKEPHDRPVDGVVTEQITILRTEGCPCLGKSAT